MLTVPEQITIVEVGPRDGLQSLDKWIPTDVKVAMIDRLSAVGFPVIEATSLAHPRVVPNLRDATEVLSRIRRRPGTIYRALVPNAKGAERAVDAGVDEMLGLVAVSETYSRKNQNMSVADAIEQAGFAFDIASRHGTGFVIAMSMSFFCPYEGRIPEVRALDVFRALYGRGIRRFYLAATVGMEDPRYVNTLFRTILARWPDVELGFHVHNLAGFGLANIIAALDAGVTRVEGAICGLGGGIVMPDVIGNLGNVPTEDLVHLLNEMGVRTGIDTAEVIRAAHDVSEMLAIRPKSYATRCGMRTDLLARAGLPVPDAERKTPSFDPMTTRSS